MELLLLGTAHFDQSSDAITLSKERKNSLSDSQFETLNSLLFQFTPEQIFTEYLVEDQEELHQMYSTDDVSSSFKRNEIYRIAFSLGHKLQLPTIYAIDWNTPDPSIPKFADLLEGTDGKKVKAILDRYQKMDLMKFDLLEEGLIPYLKYLNSEAFISRSHQMYLECMDESDLAFEWVTRYWIYRNLKIVQKIKQSWQEGTKRAILLIGASHLYLIRQAFKENKRFKVISFDEWSSSL